MQASPAALADLGSTGDACLDGPGVEQEIRDFLTGASDGRALFAALYGSVAEEPVPARLLAVVRAPRSRPRADDAAEVTASADVISLAQRRRARAASDPSLRTMDRAAR